MARALRGLFLPPFDDLADPGALIGLAREAEEAGWDGFFLWDHIDYRAPTERILDPWICLAAVAAHTRTVRLGALITPLARRRPHVVARQTATLDVLSGGRMVLGAALGLDRSGRELSAFGEELDDRTRAAMLDEALDVIAALWSGQRVDHDGPHFAARDVRFLPAPVQRPRIPVWVGGRWPAKNPLRRAARWDGYFPVDLDGPAAMADCAAAVAGLRGDLDGFDLVAGTGPWDDIGPWEEAGATWWLAAFPRDATRDDVRRRIHAGPG